MESLRDLILRGKGTPLLNIKAISRLNAEVCDPLHPKQARTVALVLGIAANAHGRLWAMAADLRCPLFGG